MSKLENEMLITAWLIVAGIGAVGLMFCFAIAMGKMIADKDEKEQTNYIINEGFGFWDKKRGGRR